MGKGRPRKAEAKRIMRLKKKRRTWDTPKNIVLPEERVRDRIERRMDRLPRRSHRREPGPRVSITPPSPIDRASVMDRVGRAMKTLRALPDRERSFQAVRCGWPAYVQEAIDAYASIESVERFRPTPRDISDYLTALSWCRHLPKNEWKILWLRSFDLSFGLIAQYIGRSDETARRRYEAVITDVWCSANGINT